MCRFEVFIMVNVKNMAFRYVTLCIWYKHFQRTSLSDHMLSHPRRL